MTEIFQDGDNQIFKGQDNFLSYQYAKVRAGDVQLNLKQGGLYTNTLSKTSTHTQSGDKPKVLNGGKLLTYPLNRQNNSLIETIKFRFDLFNNRAVDYACDNAFELIDYIEIFNNGKSIEKISRQTLHLFNQMQIKNTSYELETIHKGLTQTAILAGATLSVTMDIPCFLTKQCYHFANLGDMHVNVKFLADTVSPNIDDVYLTNSEIYMAYYEIIPSQDKYMRSLTTTDNYYLQIDQTTYYYDNVKANEPFKIKLTQEAVCPFLFFYVQAKDDAESRTNCFNNFLIPTAFELLGKNNQSLLNNVIIDRVYNRDALIKHFGDRYCVMNSGSKLYYRLNMINFALNPSQTLKNDYMGGQPLRDNQNELKITMPAVIAQAAITVFVYKYRVTHVHDKYVTFLGN